ncbi:MAG: cyclic pyranopterin monophosphate synthase MoaC [Magnetococcales bacterium]|nr:cyclic pyranopterin monophosphate synthase MoaC [Magnetococcales bacterium]
MTELSHFDSSGAARMVDVSHKIDSQRMAIAAGEVAMQPATLQLILSGSNSKGDVLGVARLAAILATKKVDELIPLCHPLPLTSVHVDFQPQLDRSAIIITARVTCSGKTGVEMEALTAVAIAGLTIYDMCKAVDRTMVLGAVRLLEKSGGRSGHFIRNDDG